MDFKVFRLAAAAAATVGLFGLAAPASAQSNVDVSVSGNFGIVTDYVFRGVSQTNEDAAIQGGLDLTAGGFYAGVWASTVDFGDTTDAEVDMYGGYRWEAAGFAWDAGLVGYTYAKEPAFADYTYAEAKLGVSRAFGPATVGAVAYYSPDFFGVDDEATYAEVNATFSPINKWTVSGAVGKQWLDVSDDYLTWNVGVAYALTDDLAVDVRYYDTDVDNAANYEDRVVAGIKVAF
ncbi:MAG: TorF family putative porin [Pseudomonadota bacterium]|jgi:uncharacterized protein (TIGR02001 family)|nr:TorF family putative porin [Pseudomonadota bacterium]